MPWRLLIPLRVWGLIWASELQVVYFVSATQWSLFLPDQCRGCCLQRWWRHQAAATFSLPGVNFNIGTMICLLPWCSTEGDEDEWFFILCFIFSPFPHLPRWVRSFLAWLFLDPACKKIYSAPRWRIPGKRSKGSRTARPQTNAPGDMRDCGLIKCYVPIPRGSFSVALSKPMEPIVDL